MEEGWKGRENGNEEIHWRREGGEVEVEVNGKRKGGFKLRS